LEDEDRKSILKYLNKFNFKCDLAYFQANLSCIIESIENVEISYLSRLVDSFNISEQVENFINELPRK